MPNRKKGLKVVHTVTKNIKIENRLKHKILLHKKTCTSDQRVKKRLKKSPQLVYYQNQKHYKNYNMIIHHLSFINSSFI